MDPPTRAEQDPIFRYYPQELILEERLGGSEHSLQGIVVDGRVVCCGVTDKWVTTPFYLEYLQIYPSALPAGTLDRVLAAADDAVAALGLDRGAIAMDLRCLPNGAVKIVEVNARNGGNFIASHLIPLSQGYDFLGAALRVATGANPEPMPAATGVVAGSIQVITGKTGRFAGFDGLGAALTVPGIEHFTYESPPGTEVCQPPEDFVSPILATLIGRAPNQQTVTQLLREAAECCRPVMVLPVPELCELFRSRNESLVPGGFIFHMSRCGSTVISRTLSASRKNLVVSEPDFILDLLNPPAPSTTICWTSGLRPLSLSWGTPAAPLSSTTSSSGRAFTQWTCLASNGCSRPPGGSSSTVTRSR